MTMGRWKGMVAWIISGGTKKEPGSHQLWVEKDTFLPIRILTGPEGKGTDLSFENYRYIKEYPWPKLITAAGVLKEELNELSVNPNLPAADEGKAGKGFTDAATGIDPALTSLIRSYYELVR